ncbi:MAG: DUF4965 domain-containing protein [Clostridia bacterium]|nr:DUF4965 domain-containing protein [Clostridia bacterium]
MKMRAPAYPLLTVDPYFSLWSMADTLNGDTVKHWTGKPNTVCGTVTVDGEEKTFMGTNGKPAMTQTSVDVNAMSTFYTFTDGKITLKLRFFTPLLADNLAIMTRPVSYVAASWTSCDGADHTVTMSLCASEELVMDKKGDDTVDCEIVDADGIPCAKMGKHEQKILNRSGDDLRIEWGYFYLGVPGGEVSSFQCDECGMTFVMGKKTLTAGDEHLFLLAYDDIESLEYYGDHVKSVWNADGQTILEAIAAAYEQYDSLVIECDAFSDKLYLDAAKAGGVKYAEMLSLAYRQVIAAHKCALDTDGNVIFVSKECFSNGCAATVDVSYPSIPMFLLYNPELVKGMMRPIFKYAESDAWKFDFAPHDAGQYPLVHGQVYGENRLDCQMPVEECGNMLVMITTTAIAEKDASYAKEHWNTLADWVKYLEKYGNDPENQLCTDDFAGHLAHNCNLAIKAIMGVACFGILNCMIGNKAEAEHYMAEAKEMAKSWAERAGNGDGSYRLAFDRPGTFSMKYNAVWDKLFGTKIFAPEVLQSELASNFSHINPYGMPLDNRSDYTKSDWLVWTATLLNSDDDFERFIEPLWQAYHRTPSRVPMTDWYFTTTSIQRGFQNRTVQGGLFIKLLDASGKMKI